MSKNCSCHGEGGHSAEPVMGLLTRPRYVPGLILEDSDLTAAVDYTRELNRLLFKSLFGCGVVCGLEVTVDFDCGLTVLVSPGLALDGCGDPIQLIDAAKISLGRAEGVLPPRGEKDPEERARNFWVIACAREKNCAPRALVCDSDDLDGASQATRTRSAVEVSLTFEPPECVCGCRKFEEGADVKSDAEDLIRQLDDQATKERGQSAVDYGCGNDPFGCHREHYTNKDCPADCGCGTACACGCCVLLAWVHWDERSKDWRVLHQGVRRFVRPCLMSDPIRDGKASDTSDTGKGTDEKPSVASDRPVGVRAPEPVATDAKPARPRALKKGAAAPPAPPAPEAEVKDKAPAPATTDKPPPQ